LSFTGGTVLVSNPALLCVSSPFIPTERLSIFEQAKSKESCMIFLLNLLEMRKRGDDFSPPGGSSRTAPVPELRRRKGGNSSTLHLELVRLNINPFKDSVSHAFRDISLFSFPSLASSP
jgi:hypothetical protein